MFVALVHYNSAGGFHKVFIVRKNNSERLTSFETSEEAQAAAEQALANGEIKRGEITVVDLSEGGVVSETESTPSYQVD